MVESVFENALNNALRSGEYNNVKRVWKLALCEMQLSIG